MNEWDGLARMTYFDLDKEREDIGYPQYDFQDSLVYFLMCEETITENYQSVKRHRWCANIFALYPVTSL